MLIVAPLILPVALAAGLAGLFCALTKVTVDNAINNR
jgi:hypothetical protein